MAWAALADGVVLLHARAAGLGRDLEAMAAYVTASHERVCAGAGKLGLDLKRLASSYQTLSRFAPADV